MILTKSQLIAETKRFSHGMLLEAQRSQVARILDSTIYDIMNVYNDCAKDCLRGSVSFRKAKQNRDILALVSLLRACSGLLISPSLITKYLSVNERVLTPEGESLYNLYDKLVDSALVDSAIEYVGPNPDIFMQSKMVDDYLLEKGVVLPRRTKSDTDRRSC